MVPSASATEARILAASARPGGTAATRALWLTGCTLGLAALLHIGAAAQPAPSQEVMEFDLPAEPLGTTLIEIGRRGGIIVSFRPALVAGHGAPPIRGRHTLEQALRLATGPSGLSVKITPGGSVTVDEAEGPAPARAEPGAEVPAASAAAQPMPRLPPVVVTGTQRPADGLIGLRGWSASRSDVPLADLPQAVSVLTAESLALQGDTSTTDALRYVPGVSFSIEPSGSGGLSLPSAQVRGLQALYALSGMRTVRSIFPVNIAVLDRIEVPKGPSAVIGGVAAFGGRGGVVNLVRKQAEPGQKTELTQSLSSQDGGTLRLTSDLGGELGGRTLWRLVGYGSQTGHTEGGYTRQGRAGLLGTLRLQGNDLAADLTLQADQDRLTPAPASRGGFFPDLGDTPPQEGIQAPPDPSDRILSRAGDVELGLDWRLSPRWRMTWKGRAEGLRSDVRRHQPFTRPVQEQSQAWSAGMQWGLGADLATGPAQHKLLLAVDAERRRQVRRNAFPVFGPQPQDGSGVDIDEFELRQSLLLQDQVRLGPWRLRLALQRTRVPFYRYAEGSVFVLDGAPMLASSWDVGALYRLSPAVSVYAGSQYSTETDNRVIDLVAPDGSPLPFTMLRQTQAGAKFDLLDHRLSLTVEAFQARRQVPPYIVFTAVPQGRAVEGLDVDMAGRLLPQLDVRLGLSVMHGIDIAATGPGDGATPVPTVHFPAANLPGRSLQMLLRYHLPEQVLARSSVTAGLRAWSASALGLPAAVITPSPYMLPGGAQLDLSWQRSVGPWSITTFLGNVFDRQLYSAAISTSYLPLQPGRSLTLTAAYRD